MATADWNGIRHYRPCTITIASPAVITSDAHGLVKNDKVVFATTGTLPTGFSVDTFYFVIEGTYSDGTTDPDTFKLAASKDGAAINTSVSQTGVHSFASPALRGLRVTQENNR